MQRMFIDHEQLLDAYDATRFMDVLALQNPSLAGDPIFFVVTLPNMGYRWVLSDRLGAINVAEQKRADRANAHTRSRELLIYKFKEMLRENRTVKAPHWRHDRFMRWDNSANRRELKKLTLALKDLGELIREYKKTSTVDVDDLANVMSIGGMHRFRHVVPEEMLEGIFCCDDCGTYAHIEEGHSTNANTLVCDSCIESYTYSECMDGYLSDDDLYPVYDSTSAFRNRNPSDYCTRRYGNNNFYGPEEDHNGYACFISDADTYYSLFPEEDFEEIEEDDEHDPMLSRYHGAARWDGFFEERNAGAWPALGVELELYAEDRRSALRRIRETMQQRDLIMEEDGSLDSYHGFECVTPPMGRGEWDTYALVTTVRKAGCVGYDTPNDDDTYGIHVNIHRRHFTPLAEARIAMFLAYAGNADFVKAVAQRDTIYNAERGNNMGGRAKPTVAQVGEYLSTNPAGCVYGSRSRGRKIAGTGKYSPVNWKENVAEFRIFQSTTNELSFKKNLEFVWALWKWTLPQSATGSAFDHKDFVKWLYKPENRKDFPNLCGYMARDKFFQKGGGSIKSTWKELTYKPSEETNEALIDGA